MATGRAVSSRLAAVGACQCVCACACVEGCGAAGNHSGTDKSPDGPLLDMERLWFQESQKEPVTN